MPTKRGGEGGGGGGACGEKGLEGGGKHLFTISSSLVPTSHMGTGQVFRWLGQIFPCRVEVGVDSDLWSGKGGGVSGVKNENFRFKV